MADEVDETEDKEEEERVSEFPDYNVLFYSE